MKIYLLKTDSYNDMAFNENNEWKVLDTDSSGKFDGLIDIYGEKAIEELKDYFENNDINDFASMPGDEFNAEDLQVDGTELIFITEI